MPHINVKCVNRKTNKKIEIRPDAHHPGHVFCFLPPFASLTPDDARTIADLLVDTAEHAEQIKARLSKGD